MKANNTQIVNRGIGGCCDKYNVDSIEVNGVIIAVRFTRWDNESRKYYEIPVSVKNQAAVIAAFPELDITEDEPGAILLRNADDETAVKVGAFAAELDGELTPEPTNTDNNNTTNDNTPSTMNANETTAICPLDFDTVFDAYNYAMAHRHDENPLAVAIPTDAHGTDYGRSLALNGVKLFAVWSDELEETANGYVYTTEAGAREAMAQVEANDREAGVYEPNYWKVFDMTKYFA